MNITKINHVGVVTVNEFDGQQGNILLTKLEALFRNSDLQVAHSCDDTGKVTKIQMFSTLDSTTIVSGASYFVAGFVSGWNESAEYRTETETKPKVSELEDPKVAALKTRLNKLGQDLSPAVEPHTNSNWRVHRKGVVGTGGCYYTDLTDVEEHVTELEGTKK
jgi:hypothetical protein